LSQQISVREYARLTTDAVKASPDCAQVSESAFNWLCQLSESFSRAGAALVQLQNQRWLKLDSYVGVIQTPCGTTLEILPKHLEADDCKIESRQLLKKMIQTALDLPTRETGVAAIELFDAPLSEWIIARFLQTLDHLIKRGIRFDYRRVEEEQRFLRGQLNVSAQMRQPPGRQHLFQIRHDLFLPDRAENRLLKVALEQVCKTTQHPANWRLAHELRGLLLEVPVSTDIDADLRAWKNDRLMAHYQPVKPWCDLILNRQMPVAVAGKWQGISLLFPMEKLFERYVAAWFERTLESSAHLRSPARSEYLCTHNEGQIFRLEPDLLVQRGTQRWVLDTKWKRVDATDRINKYGLSQSDFYQLFAYGQKYLQGQGELVLIYPKRAAFHQALPVFDFGGGLTLRVLPFDLDNECLLDISTTSLPLRSPTPNSGLLSQAQQLS
jgi:5-methylcytosine-specific restriction enzyme subunit McrC